MEPVSKRRKTSESQSYIKPPCELRLDAQDGRARACTIKLPHGEYQTPIFMPVGTKGTIKGLTSEQMESLDCKILLANTYHLGAQPGPAVLDKVGGLHKFMNWKRNILTDSGGFQMVSLFDLADITEQGVKFRNPDDGSMMMLTPEKSMELQNKIGADIMMALDDVNSSVDDDIKRFEEASNRTVRWLDRCIAAHSRPRDQCIFAIVQGGLDTSKGGLRDQNLRELKKREKSLGGYAIGGLAGGESKDAFWRVVEQCTSEERGLPKHKARYLMGVGYPIDLVVCVALGVDMFDCVFPTRTARFGVALVNEEAHKETNGSLRLKTRKFEKDSRHITESKNWSHDEPHKLTRAGHRMLLKTESVGANGVGGQMLSLHNIAYMLKLSKEMREAIKEKRFAKFVQDFMIKQYPSCEYPKWIEEAMKVAEIKLLRVGREGERGD